MSEAINRLGDAKNFVSLGYTHSALMAIDDAIKIWQAAQAQAVNGSTSDGYHTFDELYEFRKAYNAAFFNELAATNRCHVHKSWKHHDGEPCFGGGWFIVVAVLPDGQISNHYEAKDWDLFRVPETEKALFEFDGHTGADVIARLCSYKPQAQAQLNQQLLEAKESGFWGRTAARQSRVNQQLLGALRLADAVLSGSNMNMKAVEAKVKAAIAAAQEQHTPDELINCSCGDSYPSQSYGAGFIHAIGHCPNCQAAAQENNNEH